MNLSLVILVIFLSLLDYHLFHRHLSVIKCLSLCTMIFGDLPLNPLMVLNISLHSLMISLMLLMYLLKSKSEVMDVFKDFHMLVLNQFSSKIQILCSNNGT